MIEMATNNELKREQRVARREEERSAGQFRKKKLEKAPPVIRYAFPLCARDKALIAIAKPVKDACDLKGYRTSFEDVKKSLGRTANEQLGDVACMIAFEIESSKKPNEIAREIAGAMERHELVEAVEVKGPYVNFRFSQKFYELVLREALELKGEYGRGLASDQLTLVEYPSVNPNKPWHIGHLRNAVLGDCTARLIAFAGNRTNKFNYIDDLGLQVAQSMWGYRHLDRQLEGKADHWFGKKYVEVAKLFAEAEFELKVQKAFEAVRVRMEKPDLDSVAEKFGEQNDLKREEAEKEKPRIASVLERIERGEEIGRVVREVRALMHEMEEGNSEVAREARRVTEEIVRAQQETAISLGIVQDALIWESDIIQSRLLERGLRHLFDEGAIEKTREGPKAGCVVAKLRGVEEFAHMEDPDKILVRSDGTATYTGKDVCFQLWKFGLMPTRFGFREFMQQPGGQPLYTTCVGGEERDFGKPVIVVNVIGAEQKYPQATIAHVLKAIGHPAESENSIHLAYEHAELPEAKMSGRKGTWIGFTADEVIAEAVRRARVEVDSRFPEMDSTERERISKDVGVGAVRYGFIRTSPERKLLFEWDEALSFEKNSAPYLQYTHARACRILEKARTRQTGQEQQKPETQETPTQARRGQQSEQETRTQPEVQARAGESTAAQPTRTNNTTAAQQTATPQTSAQQLESVDFSLLSSNEERQLVHAISGFPEAVSAAANEFRPHLLCPYLFGLADAFNSFYKQAHVLNAETEQLREARLALVQATIQTLRNGFGILGIPAPERM